MQYVPRPFEPPRLEKWLRSKHTVIATGKLSGRDISESRSVHLGRTIIVQCIRVIVFATCNRGSEKSPILSWCMLDRLWIGKLACPPGIIERGIQLRDLSRFTRLKKVTSFHFDWRRSYKILGPIPGRDVSINIFSLKFFWHSSFIDVLGIATLSTRVRILIAELL